MPIPEKVLRLIDRFKEHREDKRDSGYKEARLRVEFLDDFFEALGWDMSNSQGYSEAYQDVVIEDSLVVEGSTKAPDYEAKKPSRNLKDDPESALQDPHDRSRFAQGI